MWVVLWRTLQIVKCLCGPSRGARSRSTTKLSTLKPHINVWWYRESMDLISSTYCTKFRIAHNASQLHQFFLKYLWYSTLTHPPNCHYILQSQQNRNILVKNIIWSDANRYMNKLHFSLKWIIIKRNVICSCFLLVVGRAVNELSRIDL